MRRPLFLVLTATVVIVATALAVNAQDDMPDNEQSNSILPITEDVRYEVGTADTLDDIAAIFDVSQECLVETNDIENPNAINVGDVLVIRVACPPYAGTNFVAFPRPISLGQGGGEATYTVRVADTLETIALAFDISPISLQEFNEIESPLDIRPGDVLSIPPDAPPFGRVPPLPGETIEAGGGSGDIIYVIQPRDTIDVIGAFYDKRVSCIIESNNIEQPPLIQPRTTIIIPEECPPYDGVNVTGRVLPFEGDPEVSVDVVRSTTTPRPTSTPTATFPAPDAPAQTAQPTMVPTFVTPTLDAPLTEEATEPVEETAEATPTPEVLEPTDDPADLGAGGAESGEVGTDGSPFDLIETLEILSGGNS